LILKDKDNIDIKSKAPSLHSSIWFFLSFSSPLVFILALCFLVRM